MLTRSDKHMSDMRNSIFEEKHIISTHLFDKNVVGDDGVNPFFTHIFTQKRRMRINSFVADCTSVVVIDRSCLTVIKDHTKKKKVVEVCL